MQKCLWLNLRVCQWEFCFFFPMKTLFLNNNYINKLASNWGTICSDICLQTLSVPGSEQFCGRVAQRKLCILGNRLCSRTNMRVHSRTKWRPLYFLSFKYFLQHVLFWKLGNITWIFSFSWGIFSHVTQIKPITFAWKYLIDYKRL